MLKETDLDDLVIKHVDVASNSERSSTKAEKI